MSERNRKRYAYVGPVCAFGKCISNCWYGTTLAYTEGRAKCNLAYQFKREHNLEPATKISLPGKLTSNE